MKKYLCFAALFAPAFTYAETVMADPAAIKDGAMRYQSYCAACHGDAAEGAINAGREISIITDSGGNQPPDLTDDASLYGTSPDDILAIIENGVPGTMMPAWKGRLTNVEMKNIVAYIHSRMGGMAQFSIEKLLDTGSQPRNPEQSPYTLVLSDYISMPVTGDLNSESNTLSQISRMNFIRQEPDTERWFIPDLNGPLYIFDDKQAAPVEYLNLKSIFPAFHDSFGFASGLVNIQFDPNYSKNGRFYTIHLEVKKNDVPLQPVQGRFKSLDLSNYKVTKTIETPSFGNENGFYGVLVEWQDSDPKNNVFEGTARELLRMDMNRHIHPMGALSFNPYAGPGDEDWGTLYVGIGETGSGGMQDARKLNAQRLNNVAGTILRIIPDVKKRTTDSSLSENGQYRVPSDNPFVKLKGARPEIWAYGLRNPHRLIWFRDNQNTPQLMAFNIGQVNWEMINIIGKGKNYGYPIYEGTQLMMPDAVKRDGDSVKLPVMVDDVPSEQTIAPSYPVLQYPHMADIGGDAISGGYIYSGTKHPELKDKLIFGDMTTGNIWYSDIASLVDANDDNPEHLASKFAFTTTLREQVESTYKKRGGTQLPLPGRGVIAGPGRIDLRFGQDRSGEIFIMTKSDGMIRKIADVVDRDSKN